MRAFTLGKRLLSASELVRQGAYLADIGTDHAYLPLFLLSAGKITHAVCADINKGPLDSARKNAEEAGLSDKLEFVLTNGAEGLSGKEITDYSVCGMGGELIADIIDRSPHLRDSSVRLILQPMSKQAELRKYLAANGFEVTREIYSHDAGKYYLCLSAQYTGEVRSITDIEAEVGLCNEKTPEYLGYFEAKRRALLKSAGGKAKGGENAEPELLLLREINRILGKQGNQNDG